MATAKGVKGSALLLILIFGYLETLRRAIFYSFGWSGYGQALTVMVLLVLTCQFINYYSPSELKRKLIAIMSFLYAVIVWYINRSCGPAEISLVEEILFGLPHFQLGSISPEYFGAFCFFVVSFYALLAFLITSYIIETKNTAEMFFFGFFLLSVLMIVLGESILEYVVLNIFFSMGLRIQIYLLETESDFRVRQVQGAGVNIRFWSWISLLFVIVIVLAALILPPLRPSINLLSSGNRIAMLVTGNSTGTKQAASGSYDLFWKRCENFDLKGEVVIENKLVMYVKSSQPFYWRGDTSDFYTGQGWQNTLYPWRVDNGEIPNPYSRIVGMDKIEQVFSLAPGVSSEVVFSSGIPVQVQLQEEYLSIDAGGNIYLAGLNLGGTYRVISYIPERDEAKLKDSTAEYPLEIKKLYLQLPQDIPERVGRLAAKLTTHAENPYDKAVIIEDYISSNYPYDLAVKPVSGSQDVTDYFLFELKKGYCTYHSTAMVVMLRSLGIPARWVKGFTSGILNSETGVYEVCMNDAHSWVEVYFADYGWVPFDPTPSVIGGETGTSADAILAITNTSSHEAEFQGLSPEEIINSKEEGVSWLPVLVLAVIIAAAAVVYYLYRTRNIFRIGTGDLIRDIYISLVEILNRKGYPKKHNQTPLEYAQDLSDKLPDDYSSIFTITNAYLVDKYGKRRLGREELEEVRAVWLDLVKKWTEKPGD
ncbi:transglutaminase TgpA family protein [Phosphitispora sp. TUW77]|uniref:transglutaminase TgpA family protein n=1 Tax=Phosphitispora sp. TUW77 TaxID=3152361 RepID=UPI003AB7DF5C